MLFIGNSLTATNDLPAMIANLAKAAGEERPFSPRAKTLGGFGLREHIAGNYVPALLSEAAWDAVVLQEQGQRAAFQASDLEEWFYAPVRQLDAMIRNARSRTVLYETFARRDGDAMNFAGDDYAAMQRRVNDVYSRAATELKAELVPVGAAWEYALRNRPSLSLWAADGMHPSVAGSYLAACAFYAHFYRHSPTGNPYLADLDATDALAIQKSAAEKVLGYAPRSEQAPADSKASEPAEASGQAPLTESEAEDRFRHERVAGAVRDRAARAARERLPIVLYTKPDCDTCEQASAYLHAQHLTLQQRDIAQDAEAAAAALRLNPRGSVPVLDVGGSALVGWDERRFEKALDAAVRKRIGEDSAAPAASASGTAVIEAESLMPVVDASAQVTAQHNCCGLTWSGNAQLFLLATKSGDDVVLSLDVPASGTYELSAVLTRAGDYGIAQLKLDGDKLGVFDGYAPDVVRTDSLSLGVVRLARGSHPLVIEVIGKHPASSGYFVGLDLLRLRALRR